MYFWMLNTESLQTHWQFMLSIMSVLNQTRKDIINTHLQPFHSGNSANGEGHLSLTARDPVVRDLYNAWRWPYLSDCLIPLCMRPSVLLHK